MQFLLKRFAFRIHTTLKERCVNKMNRVTINTDRCRGCGLCEDVCPKHIITLSGHKLNAQGYHPAEITDMSLCIACAMCATMCPHVVIKVEKNV